VYVRFKFEFEFRSRFIFVFISTVSWLCRSLKPADSADYSKKLGSTKSSDKYALILG